MGEAFPSKRTCFCLCFILCVCGGVECQAGDWQDLSVAFEMSGEKFRDARNNLATKISVQETVANEQPCSNIVIVNQGDEDENPRQWVTRFCVSLLISFCTFVFHSLTKDYRRTVAEVWGGMFGKRPSCRPRERVDAQTQWGFDNHERCHCGLGECTE
jgi:hypothetical protein